MTQDLLHPLPPDVLTEPPATTFGVGAAVLDAIVASSNPSTLAPTPPPTTEPPNHGG